MRLVVLHPQESHTRLRDDDPARRWIDDALNHRGGGPRYFKNTLLFLAADQSKIDNLERNVAQYLAWESVLADDKKQTLNLDNFQRSQAEAKRNSTTNDVGTILYDTYQWLLIPTQPDAQGGIEWKEIRLQGQDSPILRASRKAIYESELLDTYAATNLRLEALDKFLWRDTNHIDLKRLWEYLTQYLYLPRLKNQSVLLEAVRDGVTSTVWADNFAYAEGFDDVKGKYLGLRAATGISPSVSPQSLLVKPDVAQQQFATEAAQAITINTVGTITVPVGGTTGGSTPSVRASGDLSHGSGDNATKDGKQDGAGGTQAPILRRFYGNVDIDAMRINRDASAIANEVIQHLTALNGATAKITVEIEAEIPEGIPNDVARTVMENCRTLKFIHQSFEQS